jgi:PAS domain S-box-containing protein
MAVATKSPELKGSEPPRAAALFVLDGKRRIRNWTDPAERESGYDGSELRGASLELLFAPEPSGLGIAAALEHAAREGGSEIRGWFLRKDGSRIPTALMLEPIRGEPIRGEPGEAAGCVAWLAHPPSELRMAAARVDSERQFRMLVQGVIDYAVYMLDPEGYITTWNLGGERIKGYSAEDVIGRHFSIFYTPEDCANREPERALEVAAREGRYEREGWRVRKDGTRFWASIVIDRILDHNGKLIGFAKITRDMTETRQAQEELEKARAALAQSQKMEAVGQLTGGVAHDFNNLLTVISNGLDLLAGPIRDEAQRNRIIDSAQRAAERGARLTQQLLAFSRRQPLRPEVQRINRLIGGFEAVLRRACPEQLEIEFKLGAGPLAANVDAAQFETALLNLIVNARDAMPRGGRLRIVTGTARIDETRSKLMSGIAPGDYVTVSVSDTGEGMSAEVRARAFEPFFTTKDVGKGSGLGLSQVYGFVTQSGGHVEIDSTPEQGTTVTLFLPAVRQRAKTDLGNAEPERQVETAGRILVVEDDADVLDVTVETLRTLGYEVLTAPDGLSALSVLRREGGIDVLFTDIVMPRGINGVELARQAARLRPQLRILLASGYPKTALSNEHGIAPDSEFAFLSKPYRSSELAAKLHELKAQ